jgi:hypothetical protein
MPLIRIDDVLVPSSWADFLVMTTLGELVKIYATHPNAVNQERRPERRRVI